MKTAFKKKRGEERETLDLEYSKENSIECN